MQVTKREFLKSLGLAAVAAPRVARAAETSRRRLKHWIWMTPQPEKTAEDWKQALGRMRRAGIDAIVPEIYDGRHAYYPSGRFPVKLDWLSQLLPPAKAEGLEVHAWMWTMPCMVEDVMKKHPDWYSVNAKGDSALDKPAYVDYYKFLDPARPEVREFVQGTVRELASIGEIEGVHLDYVRHPDAILPKSLWSRYGVVQDRVHPEFDYGYSAYSRADFEKKHGVDPMKIQDPTGHEAWMRYRLDAVTDMVNGYLVPAAREKGKRITAAVFPGPSLARQMVRQDWGRWDLDAFLPMLYHTFYEAGPEWVTRYTREAVATVEQPVYSGLFAPPLAPAELGRTVEAALEGGAHGVSLFAASAMDEAKWRAVEGALRA